jgi:acetyltransferase
MERLIHIAKERGLESLWNLVLTENRQMISLAKKFGFRLKRVPGENYYEVTIDLRSAPQTDMA